MSTGRKPEHVPLSGIGGQERHLEDGWKLWEKRGMFGGTAHVHRVQGGTIGHNHPLGDIPHDHDPGDGTAVSSPQARPEGMHGRISLEFSGTWPGQCYLRFEAAPGGAVTMVRVNAADRAALRALLETSPLAGRAPQVPLTAAVIGGLEASLRFLLGGRACVLSGEERDALRRLHGTISGVLAEAGGD